MARDPLRNLRILHRSLDRPPASNPPAQYGIPGAWRDGRSGAGRLSVDPFEFYRRIVGSILEAPPVNSERHDRGWVRRASIYNMMIRFSTAFDHDGDGRLGVPTGTSGWRETGTFLKSIALLPWIRATGANTIHLLPVMEIGSDGRRGDLGSPYAVRNPFAIDPMLAEPALDVSAETQAAAFIEATHHLGLSVVLEIPLRTTSKDCVWAADHPEWFYWIREGVELHPPVFSPDDLAVASARVNAGDHNNLPEPPEAYRSLFADPPIPSTLRIREGRWSGISPGGEEVRVAGAFADWPPNDSQPVWSDITYLKFYQEKRFNYVSYNTVRMYDSRILEGGSRTADLWSRMPELVVHYAREYGVDGIMVDMAHAIPGELMREIIRRAREVNPAFAFWAEDFSRTTEQVETGFDAVLGGQWACQHQPVDFRDMLAWIGATPQLPPHLGAPETHNTPRAASRNGGKTYARYAWTVSCFLPALPFLHSGFELHETRPVNTGLGFATAELKSFPADALPLFSAQSLEWEKAEGPPGWVSVPLAIRNRLNALTAPGAASLRMLGAGDAKLLAFVRTAGDGSAALALVGNPDMDNSAVFRLPEIHPGPDPRDLLTGLRYVSPEGGIGGELPPGGVAVFATPGADGRTGTAPPDHAAGA